MPWGDGTGPAGYGPMTGRAAGYCAGYSVPGYANSIPGRGFGFGGRGGGGRGRRNWFYATGMPGWQRASYGYPAYGVGVPYGVPPYNPYGTATSQGVPPYTPTSQQEVDALKGQAEYLEDSLDGINKRIAELEAKVQAESKKK